MLNNINYKIDNNQQINVFDVLDLIWMPKYRWDREIESVVVELVDIYNNIIVEEYLVETLRKTLVLWAGKYVLDENNIEKVIRGLNMSAQEVIDLKRDIVTARIDGMLCRAEKAGMEAGKEVGIEAGKLETARNMVKKGYPIEEILDVTGLSKKDILDDK
jgi:predicted transposase/invertase (TIGR01784 family)